MNPLLDEGCGVPSRWELLRVASANALTRTVAEFSLVLPLVPQQPRAIPWLFTLKIRPNCKQGPVAKGEEYYKCQIFVRSQLVPGRDSCS